MAAKLQLGEKRDCPDCGARFYDLNKSPAHCPKCDHEFVPEPLLKPRKPRREDEPEEAPAAAPGAELPLAVADKDQKGAKSKKKPALDGEEATEEEDLADIDIDIDIEDDEDDTLLEEDEDDEDDDIGIVGGGDEEDV